MFENMNEHSPLMWASLLIEHLTTVNKVSNKNYVLALTEEIDLTSSEEGTRKLIMAIANPDSEKDKIYFQMPIVDYIPLALGLEAMSYKLLTSSLNMYLKIKENEQNQNIIN